VVSHRAVEDLMEIYFALTVFDVIFQIPATMRTGLDFKSAQFDPVRCEAEDWIKMRGLEI
jgi:hypothetical protein